MPTLSPDEVVALMEARWDMALKQSARRKADLASGLRFDVLTRDGFRCCYCGRTPQDHGVALHVDHVVPRAKGGGETLDNLVTACLDCNLGKSDKRI